MTKRTVIWIVLGALVIVLIGPLLDGFGWGGMMGPWMMWGWRDQGGSGFWGSPWARWLGPVLQTLLIVAAAVAVAVILSRPRPSGESPLEILRRRYAAGEISKEEFESARRALGV